MLEAPNAPFRLAAPIEHITKLDDGTVLAHVIVTSEAPDSQGEIVDYDAFKAAAPGLMKWAVLGEMHDPSRQDAGTILQLYFDDVARKVEADVHVVDPTAVKKVLNRVYKMVSIGGVKLATQLVQVGNRTYRKITKLMADELALVPRGANPDAMIAKQFVLAKRGTDMPDEIDAGVTSPLDGQPAIQDGTDRTPQQIAADDSREALEKAEESTADQNDLPDSDFAYIGSGGEKDEGGKTTPRSLRHFPIHDAAHVRNALGRLATSPFEAKARPKVEAAARRLGIGEPAGKGDMGKEEKTKKTEKVAKADTRSPEDCALDDQAKAAQKEAAHLRKLRKARTVLAKEQKLAKGNDALDAAHDALESVGEAMKEETEEQAEGSDESKDLSNLNTADAALHQFTADESSEPDEMEKRYKVVRKQAARLRKFRKAAVSLRREERRLVKAGARNSGADAKQHDAIHEALLKLGYAKCMTKTDGVPAAVMEKADTGTPDSATIMREALAAILPPDRLNAMIAKIDAVDERSKAQADQLAKIAKSPSGGGPLTPYAPVFRGLPEGEEVTDKASALRKAAAVITDPRLKEEVSQAAGLEMIRAARS